MKKKKKRHQGQCPQERRSTGVDPPPAGSAAYWEVCSNREMGWSGLDSGPKECIHVAYQQSVKRDWHWLHLASTLRSPKCLLREVGVRGTSAARTDDSKKWKYIPSSWIRRIFIVKMAKCLQIHIYRFSAIPSSVQSLSCVRLLATPWTAACQASLSITNSRSLLKLMSIE